MKLHWTKTPQGRKRMAMIQKARWSAKRKFVAGVWKEAGQSNGHTNGKTLVAVEYQNGDGKVEKVYVRRKDDPKPADVLHA